MRFRTLAIVLAASSASVAACADDGSGPSVTPSDAPASTPFDSLPAAAIFNDADVVFAQNMIPHHRQAVEMADIALGPNAQASPAVLDLANRIKAAQDPEINVMSGWLDAWGQSPERDANGTNSTSGMGTMNGVMSEEEMTALRSAKGADFDTMWMEMMISHHQGAIAMAEMERADGLNPEALALADAIISAQQAEIAEMQGALEA